MNGKVMDAAMLLMQNSGRQAEALRRQVDLLWELTEGNVWDTHTDSTDAYEKTVPSGAVAAEVRAIGGKTVRQDGALVSAAVTGVVSSDADAEVLGTLELPDELLEYLADKGYGWSAGTAYNRIEFLAEPLTFTDAATGQTVTSDRVFRAPVEKGNFRTISFSRQESGGKYRFRAYAPEDCKSYGTLDVIANVISAEYVTKTASDTLNEDMTFAVGGAANNYVYVGDRRYSDANAFNTHFADSNSTFYYELATEKIYDISDLLPDGNMLSAEAGGTLTFVQTDDTTMDVYSSVDYLIKLSEVEPE